LTSQEPKEKQKGKKNTKRETRDQHKRSLFARQRDLKSKIQGRSEVQKITKKKGKKRNRGKKSDLYHWANVVARKKKKTGRGPKTREGGENRSEKGYNCT